MKILPESGTIAENVNSDRKAEPVHAVYTGSNYSPEPNSLSGPARPI